MGECIITRGGGSIGNGGGSTLGEIRTEVITVNQAWRAPKARDNTFYVKAFGGGGSGSYIIDHTYIQYSSYSDSIVGLNAGGEGGGGGHFNEAAYSIPADTLVDISIGEGAKSDPATHIKDTYIVYRAGLTGGSTSFGSYLTANGGQGSGYSGVVNNAGTLPGTSSLGILYYDITENGMTRISQNIALYSRDFNNHAAYGGGGGGGQSKNFSFDGCTSGGYYGGGGGGGGYLNLINYTTTSGSAYGGNGGHGGYVNYNSSVAAVVGENGTSTFGNYNIANESSTKYFFGDGKYGNVYVNTSDWASRISGGGGGGGYGGRGGNGAKGILTMPQASISPIYQIYLYGLAICGGGGGGGGYGGNGGDGMVCLSPVRSRSGKEIWISSGGGGGGYGNDGSPGNMGGGGGGGYGPYGYGHGGDGVLERVNGKSGCVIIQWYDPV